MTKLSFILFSCLLISIDANAGIFDKTYKQCWNDCIEDKLPSAKNEIETKLYAGLCRDKCEEYEGCTFKVIDAQLNTTTYIVYPQYQSFKPFTMQLKPINTATDLNTTTKLLSALASTEAHRKMNCELNTNGF